MEVINLNLIPSGANPVAHASQFDTGRHTRFNLMNGATPYTLDGTETLTVSVRKNDGHIVTEAITNTSDSYVEVITTEQMTACAGDNLAQIKIEKGGDILGYLNYIMRIQVDPEDGGDPSASFIHDLEQQIADAVADQYDAADVVFDAAPTAGHGVGFAVTSEGVKTADDAVAALIPTELDDLSDVTTSAPTSGEALVWDGSKWTNGTVSTVGSIDDLNDVDTTGKAEGDSLRYDSGSGEWVAKPIVIEVTQAEYDQLVLDGDLQPLTTYVITDAPNLNATAQNLSYDGGVTSTYDMLEPDLKVNSNGITIYQTGNIITVGFTNATIDNILSALSSYATTYDIRFVVWNATKARANLISLKTTPICIDTNPWGSITGSDTLHGGFTYAFK